MNLRSIDIFHVLKQKIIEFLIILRSSFIEIDENLIILLYLGD